MWCGSQTEKTVVSVPFNCLVEPKGCKPETKFLSSGSEQIIIIIIKEAGTDSDKVGQSCHSHCIVITTSRRFKCVIQKWEKPLDFGA